MENYSFVLYFGDLSEELQEQKIQEFIEKNPEDYADMSEQEAIDSARKSIEARFPIYF